MSLVELAIVIGVLGIVFAAVFLFFSKGMQQFHFSRRQNELATAGRLALEQIADEIIWAGYLPSGGIPADEWHPIQSALAGSFTFYADFQRNGQLDDSDYRNIFLGADNSVRITDNAAMARVVGYNIISLQFEYLNETGNAFSQPLAPADHDAVRHIRVTINLQDTYMGNVYSTSMRTTISPRNLGLNRNIDPAFLPPPPLSGIAVVNVSGEPGNYTPTPSQYSMVQTLTYLGLTVVPLSDEELPFYDYEENNIDIVILRNVVGGSGWHSSIADSLNTIPCPVICLDADDAMNVYGIGTGATTALHTSVFKVEPGHPIHHGVPSSNPDSTSFQLYASPDSMNILTSISVDATCISSIDGFGSYPGLVCVKDEDLPTRRVLYGLPSVQAHTPDGMKFLRNVINWTMGGTEEGEPGEQITLVEDFEGDTGQSRHMILWEDNLNAPVSGYDSIPLLSDDFSGAKSLNWTFSSLGSGEVVLADETLRMHRPGFGSETRNVATVSLPLGAYNIWTDQLYLKVKTLTGLNEFIGSADGVFFAPVSGGPRILLDENFSGTTSATFWVSGRGRYRIHEPGWGGDGRFVTMDSNTGGTIGTVRMMFQLATAGLPDNSQFQVQYRFHDHNDRNHAYNASTGIGDFMGWNSHGNISGTINHIVNFNPESYDNTQWFNRSETFTVTGTPPNPIYLVFGQYDNDRALNISGTRGISLDNIRVTASVPYDTTYTRIGIPSLGVSWNTMAINLNAAAQGAGISSFSDDFKVTLSQSGTGPWDTYGISWDDFEVGRVGATLSLPGWSHAPMGGMDDWNVRQNPVNPLDYMWALHANPPAGVYSNNSRCYLQTPSIMVPEQATNPTLSFRHHFDMEAVAPNDYGFVQVSVAGGPWMNVGNDKWLTGGYTHSVAGMGVFSGTTAGWRTETMNLDAWKGESVSFRFVFMSNSSIVREGWYLDDFVAECLIVGHEFTSVAFRTPATQDLSFQQVDVYLGTTALSAFPGGGSWNSGELFHAYSGQVDFHSGQEWQTISLDNSYFHPSGANLIIRVESENTPLGLSGEFSAAGRSNVCRAAWGAVPPTYLPIQDIRPAARFVIEGEAVAVDEDGPQISQDLPMSFASEFTGFEAIYTSEELGLGSGITWTSGGSMNDWEIGAPLFFPDVDPALLAENGGKVAGNALTLNGGYHQNSAWSWLASSGFPMSDAAAYDTVLVRYMRCIRLPMSSNARVQVAFGNDPEAMPSEGNWITVREYNGAYHQYWQYETVNLTSVFNNHSSFDFYFIRFLLDSGPFGQAGGWNLDNVQFFGRSGGK